MRDGDRELPTHFEIMLSPRDAQLNQLPVDQLLEIHRRKEVEVFVNRGGAIQAASSGVPTSVLASLLSFMFPLLLLAAPLAWYFFSWTYALIAVVLAVIDFRATRALIVTRIREYALQNPKVLDLLISKGVVWFEYLEGEKSDLGLKDVCDTGNYNSPPLKEAFSPAERMFGTTSKVASNSDLLSESDGWHDVLDTVIERLQPTISAIFPNEADGFVEAKCELLSYAAAYEAKLWTGTEIPQVVWNTFVGSVENRIFGRIDFVPNLSGYREHADDSQEFISYSSVYLTHMHDFERIIDRQYKAEDEDFKELLSVLSPRNDLLTKETISEFSQVFERAVFLCCDELIPTLEEFV